MSVHISMTAPVLVFVAHSYMFLPLRSHLNSINKLISALLIKVKCNVVALCVFVLGAIIKILIAHK